MFLFFGGLFFCFKFLFVDCGQRSSRVARCEGAISGRILEATGRTDDVQPNGFSHERNEHDADAKQQQQQKQKQK